MTASRRFARRILAFIKLKLRRLSGEWSPYIEASIPDAELDREMRQVSIPSFGFFFMLVLSSAIATLGLLANSAPAIIGAMIIAPLMSPIIGLTYGVILFEWRQIARSLLTVVSGTALVILFAYATTRLIGLRIAGAEILNRTAPTLLDLGVAMAAGAAAAFSVTRSSIRNSIAGVAIAVALVPPLAVSGIGLALGEKATAETGVSLFRIGLYSGGSDIAHGAFVLFLANLAGIIVVAGLVLLWQGYANWKKAVPGLAVIGALSTLLLQPLGESLYTLYVKNRALRAIANLGVYHPDIFRSQGRIESLYVTRRSGLLYVDIDAIVPRQSTDNRHIEKAADIFRKHLTEELREPVVVELEAIPVDYVRILSTPDRAELQDESSGIP